MAGGGGYTREESWPPGLYRRGGATFWTKVYQNGRSVFASTKTDDLKVATRILRQRQTRAAEGAMPLPTTERVKWEEVASDLLAHYEAHGGRDLTEARQRLAHLGKFFKLWRVAAITEATITGYVVKRKGQGAAAGTVNRELSTLSRALHLAYRHRKLQRVPAIDKLQESQPRQGFFSRVEVETVVGHLPEYLKDVALFGYLTGWRRREITGLRWAYVDLEARTITLPGELSKNGQPRTLPLEGDLAALVARRWDARLIGEPEEPRVVETVFHRHGEPIDSFFKAWRSATKKAGVLGRLFHDLRRSAARNLVRSGTPEAIAMAVTGHRSRSVFSRYNIVAGDDLRHAIQRVSSYVSTLPSVTDAVTTAQPSENPAQ